MLHLFAFASGLVFAVGLGLSGMVRPEKVIGFLDFAGDWDPALAFVMGGATVTFFLLFRVTRRIARPAFAPRFHLPTRRDVDRRLLAGAALFGVGWGIAGFCPGPALTSLATGDTTVWAFVAAMATGMMTYQLADRALRQSSLGAAEPQAVTDRG
jgi:uncharacterized membrane protein YedE/YeeE